MVVGEMTYDTDVVVLGGGPGGYTAAIHAADLGLDVVLVESAPKMGGVCLTEGCIPSKTLINTVSLAQNLVDAADMGLNHTGLSYDPDKIRQWISTVVDSLSGGILKLIENRDIELVTGHGRFIEKNKLHVDGANAFIRFKYAIIATGSHINILPQGMDLPIWTSKTALTVPEIPDSLLVIGGGYIGLEIGQAYAGLGSKVSMAEFNPDLLQGADRDLINVVIKKCRKDFKAIYTGTRVTGIEQTKNGFQVEFEMKDKTVSEHFSQVLMAAGRKPNTDNLGLEVLDIQVNDRGLIPTDEQCRTSLPHVFAIGDVTTGPALAHKAGREGKVVAEVIAGKPSAFDNVAVPAVLFTMPEIAWTGLTETRAKESGTEIKVGRFPLTALGRAKSVGKTQGFVKIIAAPDTGLVLGMGIVGEHASELIAEGTLAIEMGAVLEDLIVSIHPHPTFSEAIMEAAEMAESSSVHMFKKD